MKTMPSGRKPYYVKAVSIFLITAALVAGMMGCVDEPERDLIISSSEGGLVTTPGEDTFTYNKTTVVDLVAEPDHGYQFIKWTGDVGTIRDVNAASTNITVNATCCITAVFAKEIEDWHGLNATRNDLGGSYALMNDLDSTSVGYEELAGRTANEGHGWQPIGTEQQPFTGGFYGQGHKIGDLFIDRPEGKDVGLFGFVDEGGTIDNVGLVNPTVTGHECVGGLVGKNWDGVVSNSYSTGSTGSVRGYIRVGGLMGWNRDTVTTCYSTVTVGWARSVGGLVGYNTGTVSNSYSGGSATGWQYVGGLIGTNHVGGGVINCYSSTSVLCETPPEGGLVGVNWAFVGGVRDSFWDTQTSGQDQSAGGTGKSTAEMKAMDTFSSAGWSITAVTDSNTRDPLSIWNIVDGETYPFLSWQPVS